MAGIDGARITREIDEGRWRAFVATQPHANVFHTPEMAEVFTRAKEYRASPWAASDASGSLQALFVPVEVTLMDGPLRAWTSRAVAYGGALCTADDRGARALAALLTAYRRQGGGHALFTEVRHLADAPGVGEALRSTGFVHEEHLNYLVRLDRPEAELWRGLSRSAKQRIRSAERKGVVVEETSGAASDGPYGLLEQVYRRARVPLASPSLFRAALAVLGPRGMFRIVTARLGDRVIGARFLLLHNRRLLDWYAGSDREFGSYSPNELLVWNVLRWGHEHGFDLFDFGGAGRPGEHYGPREFKAKFGGELVNFGRDVLVHAPLRLRVSRAGYDVARRLPRPYRRRSSASDSRPAPSGARA